MQKHVKVTSGKTLSRVIEEIVKDSVKSKLYKNAIEEKERQSSLREEDDDLFGGDESGKGESDKEEMPTSSKTVDAEKEKLKKGDVETKDIVNKLNLIRAGRSFKDDDISSKLDEYVNSLSKAEKVALLAFLKGLAQIVTGEVEAHAASEPGSDPADVKMKKGETKKEKSIKPNVIKGPTKTEKKPSKEDTTGPSAPITPTKR